MFDAEKSDADDKPFRPSVVHALGQMMGLVQAVLIVGAALKRDVAIDDLRGRRMGVDQDGLVGVIGLIESALFVQAGDGGVGVNDQSGDQGGAVHDQVQSAAGLGRIQSPLQNGGIIGTAAAVDVAVQFGAGLAGIYNFRQHSNASAG